MRVVPSSNAQAVARPGAAILERVRDLGARFPDASLREVQVVRAAELESVLARE